MPVSFLHFFQRQIIIFSKFSGTDHLSFKFTEADYYYPFFETREKSKQVFDDSISYCVSFRCILKKWIFSLYGSGCICLFSSILVIFAFFVFMNYLHNFNSIISVWMVFFNEYIYIYFFIRLTCSLARRISGLFIFYKIRKSQSSTKGAYFAEGVFF